MKARPIREGICWVGAVDWDRRLFDSLIPLPDGTSYNAYLVRGQDKTVLLDAVDPTMAHELMSKLEETERVDYVVAHHGEQDHSGCIPLVLDKFPGAVVVASPKAKTFLIDLLHIPEDRFMTVEDGATLDLGGRTITFIHTPWVHWPETMVSYLQPDGILFSCDFFGSHLATSDLYVANEARVYEAAKRYFAEIMMPFANVIQKNLEKLAPYDVKMIAPSHGPIYERPSFIVDAYREWTSGPPANLVAVAYVTMHGSTKVMVERLVEALSLRGVGVQQYELTGTDIGKLAISLVDAATVVIGTPTVLAGAHPLAVNAAFLANALRPRVRFVSVLNSQSWGGKAVEQIASTITNLKAEILEPVICRGLPRQADLEAVDRLADSIAGKHRSLGLL
ncbi:MAG: FprA family A-type flavoprotein [Firmicutes bacterium]|nr:FprA family A-type flavoprotein [Bacillota bacterium]